MSVDDIKNLRLGEVVKVKIDESHSIKGIVQGIDLWEKRIRVSKDEYTCDWFPPRLISKLK
jgi:hypothetical protein